jgi:hypothetical protein
VVVLYNPKSKLFLVIYQVHCFNGDNENKCHQLELCVLHNILSKSHKVCCVEARQNFHGAQLIAHVSHPDGSRVERR